MAVFEHGWLMLHAGVAPQWDLALTLELAGEVERHLKSEALVDFLHVMYGNEPARWDPSLSGADRLRFSVNVMTRIRFVAADGTLDFRPRTAAPHRRPGSTAGSMRRTGAPRACRSRSATGRRSGWSNATTCSASTPAASGAGGSARSASTAAGASSRRWSARKRSGQADDCATPTDDRRVVVAIRLPVDFSFKGLPWSRSSPTCRRP
jgi:diadenosine tetraphosphatase ApaH/serine/threonine PP2A family protein phosphatase